MKMTNLLLINIAYTKDPNVGGKRELNTLGARCTVRSATVCWREHAPLGWPLAGHL